MSVEPNKAEVMDTAELKAGWAPMPVLLIGLLALLIYWGLTQLEEHGGGFNKQVYAPYDSYQTVTDMQPHNPGEELYRNGKRLFEANCAACHMANGAGSIAVNAPPLAGSEWVNAAGPNRIARIVLHGLKGPITVKGQAFGAGQMVPWRDVFKDDQIAAILTYIRGNKEWGNTADPVTAEQVKAIREATAKRPSEQPWTTDELLKVPEKD